MFNNDFSFEIQKKLGVISEGTKGWNLELNLVSWNGKSPKYEIRTWSNDHQKMGKGVTLSKEEIISLKNLLNSLDFD